MDYLQILFLALVLPIFSLVLHELTHLIVARVVAPVSVELISYVPFRLQLDFYYTPGRFKLRLVALAPLFVGGIAGVLAIRSGFWRQLQYVNPYYMRFLIGINWLLYITPSPADLRLGLATTESTADKEVV